MTKFLEYKLTREDLLGIRLKHSLNILQAVCYYGAEKILKYLKKEFQDDEPGKAVLKDYAEPNGGNMAIHFAVLKGNKRIIDILLDDFEADPHVTTGNGLNVIHCAAQFERGVLSIELFFDPKFGFNINCKDKFLCTPLHFAVLNLQVKCVECLLAYGADPNAKNLDN